MRPISSIALNTYLSQYLKFLDYINEGVDCDSRIAPQADVGTEANSKETCIGNIQIDLGITNLGKFWCHRFYRQEPKASKFRSYR